ncbi:MAG: NAD(P) transhydrogenase subunit alpha [Spirochaetes bacterium]|nr:NAD(P) transhydrogenase subunit alpha [Spirochaetota bacterium]HOJ29367.1 NAD(P) transhydrogenase subunit alpha [Spirochaetota bacterium]HOM10291.1 NAD(P) transhydrogenase subunit alpha [Spirochaetota bacterium]HPP50134.1 NAD(P) transhydrogenase subunit alpha [Spirochaetota bacterium]HXK66247.1 NAD(P) transhydrogenase subunit alpha [Spirochaetota bacterium]
MVIGILKEIMEGEKRVAATPQTVKKMIADGYKVLVETGAGEGSFYNDDEYKAVGATITDTESIYHESEVILKVKEPLFNNILNIHEVDLLHSGQIIISFLHPASPDNHEMIKKLTAKGVTGLTLDGVPRISRAQSMDALSSMSSCAGYKGMLLAANAIAKFMPMITSAVGVVKPANVLVVGAGVAGLRGIATAKGLGAVVYAADIRPDANEQAKSLGAKIIDTGVPADIAVSQDGKYANKLPEEWLKVERESLKDIIAQADIVFLTALVFGKKAPILVDEEMVKLMQPGSCIADISIDQGGNCSITQPGVISQKHGVNIIGYKNIPGMLPASSTDMFSNNIYNLLKYLTVDGKIKLDLSDEIVKSILVCHEGVLLHEGTLEAMSQK